MTATDQDAGDTHTFSIADANSAFEVVDNVLKLKDEVALDFEEIEQLSVTITVTDAAGASFDREFVITVNDATSEGVGADGYIAGAEVFADANENESVILARTGRRQMRLEISHFLAPLSAPSCCRAARIFLPVTNSRGSCERLQDRKLLRR